MKNPNTPLPPTPSPLRSEGETRQDNSANRKEAQFPSPLRVEGLGEGSTLYTRTTLEIWDKIKPFAREMRHDPTPAEDKLWQRLRRKSLGGYKFRRQHPIDRFIVDFFCAEARMIIEVDGGIHDEQQEADQLRTEFLESLGLRVLRFTNGEVI